MKGKLQAILTAANNIHKYANKFDDFSEDIKEDILIHGDNVLYLTKELLGLSDEELEHLCYIYYDKYLIGNDIKFEEVVDKYLSDIEK